MAADEKGGRDPLMNDVLVDALRHKAWAMKTLIDACEGVPVDTGHGRVDLLVDGQTGRVVGER